MSDTDATTRLNAALEGRYRIERELGEGGIEVLGRDVLVQDLGGMVSIPFSSSYDVHPDGDLFVFFQGEGVGLVSSASADATLTVATHWFTELRERLGEGK